MKTERKPVQTTAPEALFWLFWLAKAAAIVAAWCLFALILDVSLEGPERQPNAVDAVVEAIGVSAAGAAAGMALIGMLARRIMMAGGFSWPPAAPNAGLTSSLSSEEAATGFGWSRTLSPG